MNFTVARLSLLGLMIMGALCMLQEPAASQERRGVIPQLRLFLRIGENGKVKIFKERLDALGIARG